MDEFEHTCKGCGKPMMSPDQLLATIFAKADKTLENELFFGPVAIPVVEGVTVNDWLLRGVRQHERGILRVEMSYQKDAMGQPIWKEIKHLCPQRVKFEAGDTLHYKMEMPIQVQEETAKMISLFFGWFMLCLANGTISLNKADGVDVTLPTGGTVRVKHLTEPE